MVVATLLAGNVLVVACAGKHTGNAASLAASPARDGNGNRCDSIPPVGWRIDAVFGSVTIEPADSTLVGWDAMLLDGLREYFALPEGVRVPVHSGVAQPPWSRSGNDTASLLITGEVSAKLDPTGKLGAPKLVVSTLSPAIDESLMASMRSLDSARVIPPFPRMMVEHSGSVTFAVTQHRDSSKYARPLAVVQQPMWLYERPTTAVRGNPSPYYPSDARDVKLEGRFCSVSS